MSGAHPSSCRCPDCQRQIEHDADRAQAQTLSLLDLLSAQRRELRQLQTDMSTTIERLCERIASVIGTEHRARAERGQEADPTPATTDGPTPKKRRGLALLSPERRKQIASLGGQTTKKNGTAHKYRSAQASEAGKKGGGHWRDHPDHMREIGRKGGLAKKGYRQHRASQTDASKSDD